MSAPAEKIEIPTTKPEQKKVETVTQSTPVVEQKPEKKEETKTLVANYKKLVYYFFASTAGLLVSYFVYRRFQKRN